jgi:hypothetical protein
MELAKVGVRLDVILSDPTIRDLITTSLEQPGMARYGLMALAELKEKNGKAISTLVSDINLLDLLQDVLRQDSAQFAFVFPLVFDVLKAMASSDFSGAKARLI